ncbi:MAG: CCA tRNA nucleotidyltransferase [Alphaproteobacteria bacterium]|nr:CCA tRNA nucleotidyltransferase [Alphaproteobacteria bacterium]
MVGLAIPRMDSAPEKIAPPPPWLDAEPARDVLAALGGQARFVGGCVRDALLGQPPADLDLATPLVPEKVIGMLEAAGLKAVPTGIAHGTVTAIARGRKFEITTLRRDVETDGRHAVVAFTEDWRADAERRDFTINAMSMSADGTLHDYFDGRADLAARRLRFVGDPATRLAEDVLRLLRFFRFHARFGGAEFDAPGLAACTAAAGALPGLSAERVAGELLRLLEGPRAAEMIAAMRAAGALAHWLPEAAGTQTLARLEAHVAASGTSPSGLRALAALVPGDAAATVAQRLKLSNADADRLAALVRPAVRLDPHAESPVRRAAFYRLAGDPADHVLLAWARDVDGLAGDKAWLALLGHARGWVRPRFPLNGADARAAGIEPGPAMGAWLRRYEDAWVDFGAVESRAALLARMRTRP